MTGPEELREKTGRFGTSWSTRGGGVGGRARSGEVDWMAEEEVPVDAGEEKPPPEKPPAPPLSELQLTIGEQAKYIADHFDKLYESLAALKVRQFLLTSTSPSLACTLSVTCTCRRSVLH